MKFMFNNCLKLTIDKDYIKDIDDDDEAFYIECIYSIYTIYKKDILYVIYTK